MTNYYKCDLGHQQIAGAVSLCDRCIVAREHQRVKLLAFVKSVAEKQNDSNWYLDNEAYELPYQAEDVLREIGELK